MIESIAFTGHASISSGINQSFRYLPVTGKHTPIHIRHISFNSIPKSVLLLSNGVKAAKHWLRSASLAVNLQNSHRARTREKSGRKCRKLGKDHKDSKLCRYETHVVSHFIDLNMTRKLGQGKNFNVLSANEKCEDGRSWQGNYAQWSFTSPI